MMRRHDTASFPGKIMALAAYGHARLARPVCTSCACWHAPVGYAGRHAPVGMRGRAEWVERLVHVALRFNREFLSQNSIRCFGA